MAKRGSAGARRAIVPASVDGALPSREKILSRVAVASSSIALAFPSLPDASSSGAEPFPSLAGERPSLGKIFSTVAKIFSALAKILSSLPKIFPSLADAFSSLAHASSSIDDPFSWRPPASATKEDTSPSLDGPIATRDDASSPVADAIDTMDGIFRSLADAIASQDGIFGPKARPLRAVGLGWPPLVRSGTTLEFVLSTKHATPSFDDDAPSMARVPTARGGPPKLPGPKHDLAHVRKLAKYAAVGRQRARREVANRLGVGEPEAEAYIRARLGTLASGSYVGTYAMEWDPRVVADVYGLVDEHGGWYVKFYLEHGRVVVASFHEPEHDVVCKDGTKVRGCR